MSKQAEEYLRKEIPKRIWKEFESRLESPYTEVSYKKLAELLEHFHSQEMERKMPSDKEINNRFPSRNGADVLMDYNLARRESAKWLKQELLNK